MNKTLKTLKTFEEHFDEFSSLENNGFKTVENEDNLLGIAKLDGEVIIKPKYESINNSMSTHSGIIVAYLPDGTKEKIHIDSYLDEGLEIEKVLSNDSDGGHVIHVYMDGKQKGGYFSTKGETKEEFIKRINPAIQEEYGHYGNVTELKDVSEGANYDEDIDYTFTYMMLGRMMADCDYFLGYGSGSEKVLHQGSVDLQIKEMKKLWNYLPKDKKPKWLSMEGISDYETDMKDKLKSKMEKGDSNYNEGIDNGEEESERLVGSYYFDTRYDKPFRITSFGGDKKEIDIEYIDLKNKKSNPKTITKKEFDYMVKTGAWNKYTQPFTHADDGVITFGDNTTASHGDNAQDIFLNNVNVGWLLEGFREGKHQGLYITYVADTPINRKQLGENWEESEDKGILEVRFKSISAFEKYLYETKDDRLNKIVKSALESRI